MNTIIDEFLAGKLNGGSQVLGLKEGAFHFNELHLQLKYFIPF